MPMPITRISSSSINQGQTMHCPLVLLPMQLPRSLSLQARSARLRMTFSNWYFLPHYDMILYPYLYYLHLPRTTSCQLVTICVLCYPQWSLNVCVIHPPTTHFIRLLPQQSIPSSTLCVHMSVRVCVRVFACIS